MIKYYNNHTNIRKHPGYGLETYGYGPSLHTMSGDRLKKNQKCSYEIFFIYFSLNFIYDM